MPTPPPSPPPSPWRRVAAAVAGEGEHAADDDGRAGDGAAGDQRPPAEAALRRRLGDRRRAPAVADLGAVERRLDLVDVGRRRPDDGRAAAQQVRRVRRPARARSASPGRTAGTLVVGVDAGHDLGAVGEVDDQPPLGALVDDVRRRRRSRCARRASPSATTSRRSGRSITVTGSPGRASVGRATSTSRPLSRRTRAATVVGRPRACRAAGWPSR